MQDWEIRYYSLRAAIDHLYEATISQQMSEDMTVDRLKACAIIRAYHIGLKSGIEEMENNFDGTDFDEIEMKAGIANAMAKKMVKEIMKFQEENQ